MISKSDKNFLNICFDAAREVETTGRARLSAIIVHKNRIISVGYNQKKSSPFQAEFAKNEDAIYFHAETHAIKNFLRIGDKEVLKKSTLYVARAITDQKRRNWKPAISKPCSGCQRAIEEYKIGRVVYFGETCDPEELNMEKSYA